MAKTLNVAIAGAGISGFTAAISLRRSGHRVTIYERSSLKKEVGAAIHFPPNAGRFLIPWGLDPVKNRFVASKGVWIISPTTLDVWQFHDYEHNEKVFGQPLYHAHRVDRRCYFSFDLVMSLSTPALELCLKSCDSK
jgi:salicylate hydroxylase